MKKCPKCGTVSDDSKKKCYMCGADLTKQVAIVNNVPQNEPIEKPVNNFNNANAEVFFSSEPGDNTAMNTNFYNNSELNSTNSIQNNEKSKMEKMFVDQEKLNSKEEAKVEKKKLGKINKKSTKDKKKKKVVEAVSKQAEPQEIEQLEPQMFNNDQTINWGDNLNTNTTNTNNSVKNNAKAPLTKSSNFRLIFNIVCTVLFVGCIIFAVVLFINRNSDGKGLFKNNNKDADLFGGLYYKIDSSFTLKTKESNRRHYTMGENCSISISYGTTKDKDGFVDNYFESIKNSYEKQDGFTTQKTDLTIQGNQWSEMSIIELRKTGESDISYSTYTRYKYISIVNKGNFYTIMFANTDDNVDCSAKYDKMIGSLSFE